MADYISRPYYGDTIRRSDGKIVAPVSDDQDTDYLAWLAWCAEGGQPDVDESLPPPEAPPVPEVVEARQLLTALEVAGLLDDIEAFVSAQSRIVQINWQRAIYFRRDHDLLNAAATGMGMSAQDVDNLFIAAASIP